LVGLNDRRLTQDCPNQIPQGIKAAPWCHARVPYSCGNWHLIEERDEGRPCSTNLRCMHESDSSRHYGRHWHHAEANANSVSEYINVHENVAHLCIKLIELFRCPFVNFLLKVRDEAAEFPDSCVTAFPTWHSQMSTKQTNVEHTCASSPQLHHCQPHRVRHSVLGHQDHLGRRDVCRNRTPNP